MTETKDLCTFEPNAESDLYLSLIEPAWRSTIINKALSSFLSAQALIDIGDGNGVVSFWRKLDRRRFGAEGTPEEKADPELWDVITKSEPWDLFQFAAKYLTLHQLKHGRPWQASTVITGDKTRKSRAR